MNFYNHLLEHNIRPTKQQRAAIDSIDGAILLLAVPGSGKTTVLVARLGFMIYEKHIEPERILTLTYTVSATKDMSERFKSLFGDEYAERLEFRTINGICARIINYYGRMIGKSAFSLVTDDRMNSELLGHIYQQVEKEYATESDLKTVRSLITYIKNMMLGPDEIKHLDEAEEIKISEIYRLYQEEMRNRGLMDYDDQMVYALMILQRSPETLYYFQTKYPYISVDEAQDTSKIQHEIIKLLASGSGNLFMVGDEDQSIYGFRAAYPEALLDFEKEHKGARVLLMEENFRSGRHIVDKAQHFIGMNVLRHEKTMFTKNPATGVIRNIELKSRNAAYSYLLKVATDCTCETAVLYRDNESILPLIDLLERNGVPYRVKNMDLTFFTHRTITDISHIIHFAKNPSDEELFMQIYYKMKTYLSKALAQQACMESRKHQIPIIDAALRYCKLPRGTENSLQDIRLNLKNLLSDKADQAIGRITRQMGYNDYLDRSKISDSKIMILKSLSYREESPLSLLDRLNELRQILRERDNDPDCPFILSTIHSSKGLEYETVYLLDSIDGIFPQEVPDIAWKSSSIRKSASGDDLLELKIFEEERRLFYVGLTRAKKDLFIFEYKNEDTTFLNELFDRGHTRRPDTSGHSAGAIDHPGFFMRSGAVTYTSTLRYNASTPVAYMERSSAKPVKDFSEDEYRAFIDSLAEGVRVVHKKMGNGTIISLDNRTILIRFDTGKESSLQLHFLYSHDLLKLL
ncbi:ATP-dependent helicase [Oribacterium sp. WCC10]|uniref:ATP-dependent helicase n=1 Tax=Oribacterium sp. WCC10 TaxID=1855343 RepID=UPI0008E8CD25|nr:ATP-dependent helicase [Oribacterium sp. WCC10]SFG42833.1 DNA helicase-2 / ATP-dependent DNA helicase PcrA [Oribacterium sp. WCC10]